MMINGGGGLNKSQTKFLQAAAEKYNSVNSNSTPQNSQVGKRSFEPLAPYMP